MIAAFLFSFSSSINSYVFHLLLQISMSVNWRHIHAIPMPTAPTQMAASTVHVWKVLKEMELSVQV